MPGAEAAFARRDTDADWREIGASNPYWGVISQPQFEKDSLTAEAVEDFYKTGRDQIDEIARDLGWLAGRTPSGRALDFGCGLGRLTEAMTRFADPVIGYDISPAMLELARARGGGVTYVDELPDGPFDWINSFIVFQHIPPERGLALLRQLMERLSADGMISLHVTAWRDPRLEPGAAKGVKGLLLALRRWRSARRLPAGHIHMFDYDLSAVIRILNEADILDLRLMSTNHSGHHGVSILGRKAAPQHSQVNRFC
ncbi:class I SAM-dependent methyltransferase [Phenylobacterium sp.]|jgi:SAM-dependent methyltransferase|uniref:class I SAM-dependent methyltransferase n=1 Tax=Phenylobacterium sp. TaxID=1871053 RepID=UPI002F417F13